MNRAKVRSAGNHRTDGARRRDEILDAALRCFDRNGLLGVGIEDIRREAGASPSSMYNLFANRQMIVLTLLIRTFEALFAHITARVDGTRTAKQTVCTLVDAHIEWIAAHPTQGRFMYQAMSVAEHGLAPEARDHLVKAKSAALGPLLAHVQTFIAKGQLPAWSPTLLDVVILGAAHEGLRRWLQGATELDPNALRGLLPELAWKSLRSVPQRARS